MKSAVSAGMNRQLLTRSSSLIFWVTVRLSSWWVFGGSEKRKNKAVRERAPMGRLILESQSYYLDCILKAYQKHHLHPKDCVKAPPTTGAAIAAVMSTDAIKPRNIGRLSRGTMCNRTVKHPASCPEKASPVTALPTTNIIDDAAVAQSSDPTRKIALLSRNIILIEKSLYIFANPN